MANKVFKVTFGYSVWVEAADERDAEDAGLDRIIEDNPLFSEMGVEVEAENDPQLLKEMEN